MKFLVCYDETKEAQKALKVAREAVALELEAHIAGRGQLPGTLDAVEPRVAHERVGIVPGWQGGQLWPALEGVLGVRAA